MSADLLREAAAKIRERAQAATPGPWSPYRTGNWAHDNYVTSRDLNGVAMQYALVWSGTDAEHIASWHPAVALAVADWLDMCAGNLVSYGPNAASPWVKPHTDMALAVAHAYLGGDA